MTHRWILASSNLGKLKEIKTALSPSGLIIVPQSDFNIDPAEETGSTFLENALQKARHVASQTGQPAIADDSGLVVDALSGQPGIRSARFAGSHANDNDNVNKLLDALKNVPKERRGAYFYCVVVAIKGPTDPVPLIGIGSWSGIIVRKPRGETGFGYDPIFLVPELKCTAAELPLEVKNRLSHRAQALAQIQRSLAVNLDYD
jgi:XTP/dITP diphosphohydrolase